MGAPLYIINYTKKECIGFDGGSINNELRVLLPFYTDLIIHKKWSQDDNIIIETISCGLEFHLEEYEAESPYWGLKCIKQIHWRELV